MAPHHGPMYMRTSRPKTPVIYANDETFPIGGSKVLRQSANDVATVIGAGVTLFEALKAYDALAAEGIAIRVIDLYSIQPIDAASLIAAARETGRLITVEDHYAVGGIGDAVARAVAPAGLTVTRLAVPRDPAQRQARRAGRSLRHLRARNRGRDTLTPRRCVAYTRLPGVLALLLALQAGRLPLTR